MKVICINAGYIDSDNGRNVIDGMDLIENNEYTVIDSFIDKGYCWYVLAEDIDDDGGGYDSRRFESLTCTNSAVKQAKKIISSKKKWYQKNKSIEQ